MFTDADVESVRHVVQHILVPIIFLVGLFGNSISVYVLTRKRFLCSTNVYLTALAVTDMFYLLMAFLLSLKHYETVQKNFELYWICYGWIVWLCDACAYISIYIAVCFTIERFIAIRYPLQRKTLCTESLAKKVICGVVLFCLISTISTIFEHNYRIDVRLTDQFGQSCNNSVTSDADASIIFENAQERSAYQNESDGNSPLLVQNIHGNSYSFVNESQILRKARVLENLGGKRKQCKNETFYENTFTPLGKSAMYKQIWYLFTLFVFVLIPLCTLCTFNSFLIILVRRSKCVRSEMTKIQSFKRVVHKASFRAGTGSLSQENRITITLIAVVLLFIICQLPWATYLILIEYIDLDTRDQAVYGNIFNFLAAVNAAANFFLYYLISDTYRRSVCALIFGNKNNNNFNTVDTKTIKESPL